LIRLDSLILFIQLTLVIDITEFQAMEDFAPDLWDENACFRIANMDHFTVFTVRDAKQAKKNVKTKLLDEGQFQSPDRPYGSPGPFSPAGFYNRGRSSGSATAASDVSDLAAQMQQMQLQNQQLQRMMFMQMQMQQPNLQVPAAVHPGVPLITSPTHRPGVPNVVGGNNPTNPLSPLGSATAIAAHQFPSSHTAPPAFNNTGVYNTGGGGNQGFPSSMTAPVGPPNVNADGAARKKRANTQQ